MFSSGLAKRSGRPVSSCLDFNITLAFVICLRTDIHYRAVMWDAHLYAVNMHSDINNKGKRKVGSGKSKM